MKIYCIECKHFSPRVSGYMLGFVEGDRVFDRCLHLKNMGTWRSPHEPISEPKYINKRNDCKWFDRVAEMSKNGENFTESPGKTARLDK